VTANRNIYVYADWKGLPTPAFMGILHSSVVRGKEIFSFEYDKKWTAHRQFRVIDPDLGQFTGAQYVRDEKINFGIFLDSAPDRWGRMLIKKREAMLARREKRLPQTLFETDYLLGVYDGCRMGALRFKTTPEGDFLDNQKTLSVPPWQSIRDLEYASWQLEQGNAVDKPDYAKWLNRLVAPGSSLGGARPKASVIDSQKQLWMAKFPSRNDNKDTGAWEAVVNKLAADCGITAPESMSRKFAGQQHTFLSKRFDRTPTGERVHFASAMTVLGQKDGADYTVGASYLSLAEFIMANGAEVEKNLAELWRRIVFNIAISNCDDHLRNHGFLLTTKGWLLSPAFDMNPDELGTGLKLAVSEDDNALDFRLALGVAPYFRLSKTQAATILKKVRQAVSRWQKTAQQAGISRNEQEQMRPAFRY
jgi:serine/threonine-protein kinase HipA